MIKCRWGMPSSCKIPNKAENCYSARAQSCVTPWRLISPQWGGGGHCPHPESESSDCHHSHWSIPPSPHSLYYWDLLSDCDPRLRLWGLCNVFLVFTSPAKQNFYTHLFRRLSDVPSLSSPPWKGNPQMNYGLSSLVTWSCSISHPASLL